MSSKTKILVFRAKDLISTGIFVLLGILLIILLAAVFAPKKSGQSEQRGATGTEVNTYIPGVYTTSLLLGDNAIDIEVVVDADNINSVRLVNISESIATMYPLIEPSFDQIAKQVYERQSLSGITYQEESKYTSMVLLEAIGASLNKARAAKEEGGENQSEKTKEILD